MKKALLFVLSLWAVCAVKAADLNGSFGSGSTYATSTVNGVKTLTLHVGAAGDFSTWYSGLNNSNTQPTNTELQSSSRIVVTGMLNASDLSAVGSCVLSSGMINLYDATVSDADVKTVVPGYSWGNTGQLSVILPKTSAIDLLGFAYTNDWNKLVYKFKSVMKFDGTTLSYTGSVNGLFATDAAAAIAALPEVKHATALVIEMTSLNDAADIPAITGMLTDLTAVSIAGNNNANTQMNGDLVVSQTSKLQSLSVTNTIVNGKVTANDNSSLAFLSLNGSKLNANTVSATGNPKLAVVMVPDGTQIDLAGSENAITASQTNGVFTLNIVHPGQLAAALLDATVKSIVAKASTFRVTGSPMSAADFAALSSVSAPAIDLSKAAFAADVNGLSLSNTTASYIIMPDGTDKTLLNAAAFEGCTALKAAFAGTYAPQADQSEWITAITAYVKEPNSLRAAMEQDPRIKTNENEFRSRKIVKATLSGNLMPDDLAMGYYNGNVLDADGHLAYSVRKGELTATGTGIHEKVALANANLQYLDLTDAVFAKQTDMNFSCLVAGTTLQTLKLPVSASMTLIPGCALSNFKSLKELCVPYNFTTIDEGAFFNAPILHMTTTDADGNLIDKGPRTLTLSANLKEIKTAAFNLGTDVSNSPTDVYVLAKQAPLCAKDAFTQGMLYGWGGYRPTVGAITREDYDRFSILHFPDDVSSAEAKNYTDLTRVYSQPDAKLTTDGSGKVIMWPSQSEYNRAFEQANTGYIWNAWRKDRDSYTNAIKTQGSLNAITQAQGDQMWDANGSPAGMTYDTRYMGWHQFTLASRVNYEDPAPRWNMSSYKYNDWYTICVPFDMTKEDLLAYFGTEADASVTVVDKPSGKITRLEPGDKLYPDVRALTSVTRNQPMITLNLSKNLTMDDHKYDYVSSLTPSYSTYAPGEPVIKAGYPYLIKPALTEEELEQARQGLRVKVMTDGMVKSTPDIDEQVMIRKPKLDYSVHAYDGNGFEIMGYHYAFIGTFIDAEVPAASGYYYLGHSVSKNQNQFFRQMKSAPLPWRSYSCVIGAKATCSMSRNVTSDGVFLTVCPTPLVHDHFDNGAKPNYVLAFDSGETTGITELVETTRPTTEGTTRVYGLNGQRVGDTVNGLPAGVYIVNGKKYVVR